MQAFFRVFFAAVLALPSHALGQGRGDALQAAFSDWLDAHETTGDLATAAKDAHMRWQFGNQNRADAEPGELASLSKSITAICIHNLVTSDDLAWSDSAAALVTGAPDVTVAELVTHSSGLGPDATQVAMPLWLDQTPGERGHFGQAVLDLVTARPTQDGTRGTYRYNNENYAILGLIIEAVTDEPYFTACASRLALPPGITPSVQSGVFQPWGGLQADPQAYLTFLNTHFGPGSAIGIDPFAFPHVAMGGGAYYGLGMVFRVFGDSHNFWHFGAQCFPGRLEAGSYAVMWEGQASLVALYDACVSWDDMAALDTALSAAQYRRAE